MKRGEKQAVIIVLTSFLLVGLFYVGILTVAVLIIKAIWQW